MLVTRLKEFEYYPLLTTSDGNTYIGREIITRVSMLVRAFSCLGITSDDTVGIYCKNEMYGIATILACISYGANFTVLDTTDAIEDTRVKIVLAGVSNSLIVSEEVLDESIITLNPNTFEIINKGWAYFTLDDVERQQIRQIYKVVRDLELDKWKAKVIDEDILFDTEHSYDYLVGINFHIGITKGIFNASRFKIQDILKGIEEATNHYVAKDAKTVLMFEPFNLLYDIVNGILAPLLNGKHVVVAKNTDLSSVANGIIKSKADTLYVSNLTWKWFLTSLKKEDKNRKFCKTYFTKRMFRKLLGDNFKHVIITGKITENAGLFNMLRVKYSNLYVMNEVISFIGSATYNKIPKKIWLTPRPNVSLRAGGNDSTYGEINIICDDLFHSYLHNQEKTLYFDITIHESTPKDVEGKFKTEDIGLTRNGKLLILGKAKNIFVNENGVVIETGKIRMIAKRFKVIREATLVNYQNKLILLVEPDFEYIDNNYNDEGIVVRDLQKVLNLVNKSVRKHSQLHKIIWTKDPNGLPRKNYRIISNHF